MFRLESCQFEGMTALRPGFWRWSSINHTPVVFFGCPECGTLTQLEPWTYNIDATGFTRGAVCNSGKCGFYDDLTLEDYSPPTGVTP